MELDDKIVLLSAFFGALAAVLFLAWFGDATGVIEKYLGPTLVGLAGALAALVKR